MTRRTRTIITAALAAAGALVIAQVAGSLVTNDYKKLERFSSTSGRFAVMLPSPVKESLDSVTTDFGALTVGTCRARSKFVQFIVSYADYPGDSVNQTGPAQFLSYAAKSAVANVNGKLLKEDAYLHKGTAAREVKAKAGRGVYLRCLVMLVGNRLYQVMALSTGGHISDSKVNHVFDSFETTGAADTAAAATAPNGVSAPTTR